MALGLAETARLAVDLSLKGNFASSLAANKKALSGFDAKVTDTQGRAYKAGQQIGTGFLNAAKLIAGGGAIAAGGLVAVLKVAGNFESQLNVINTIAHRNATDLGEIGKAIRKVATDSGTPLEDLTQGYYDLLSAGIKAADATKVLTAANTLAIGGLSTTAEAVDLLTTAVNVYGGGAQGAAKYADIFAKTIERGKITAADLAGSFSQVGSIAKASGISLGELGAAYARLTAAGTPAAEASTQVRSAIVALTKVTKPLEDLQKQTGRNYLSIAGKQGLVAALEIMRKDAAKAGIPLIDLLGRVEGLNFTLATTGPNFAAYNADLAAMGEATGTAAAQMAERQKGLNFQLGILKARIKDAAITIGSTVLPRIVPVFERLNKALADPKVISQIQVFADKVAGLFTDANIEAGINALKGAFEVARDAAPAIADAARITGSALKIAVDLFKSLPPEIQGLAVAGLAINKITGGLVTNIAGGLISSVLKQLVSGVVNVNGAVVNVVGGGLPGAAASAAGTGAAAAGGISAGAVATAVAVPVVLIGGTALSLKEIGDAAQKNNDLAAKGLSFNEITAVKFYNASQAWQQQALKQGIQQPTRADFEAGMAKLAAVQTAASATASFDTRSEAAGIRESVTANAVAVAGAIHKSVSETTLAFRAATRNLRDAKSGAAIAAAVKASLSKIFTEGKGGSGGAANVLAQLRAQLKNTHDPALQRVLQSAISRVEHKMASRLVVEGQLKKADQIAKSNLTNGQKIVALRHVQEVIGNRNALATKRVQEKIDAAKRAQVAAVAKTTAVLKSKDFSVAVKNVINVIAKVSTKQTTTAQAIQDNYYNVPS